MPGPPRSAAEQNPNIRSKLRLIHRLSGVSLLTSGFQILILILLTRVSKSLMTPSKRATSLDVANLAQVSRTTVSFVLNEVPGVSISESTRKRVKDAARALKYFPNAAGRT